MVEAEEHGVGSDCAERCKAGPEGEQVDGALVFVNLDGVSSAEGDVGAVEAGEVAEVAGGADVAVFAGGACVDF